MVAVQFPFLVLVQVQVFTSRSMRTAGTGSSRPHCRGDSRGGRPGRRSPPSGGGGGAGEEGEVVAAGTGWVLAVQPTGPAAARRCRRHTGGDPARRRACCSRSGRHRSPEAPSHVTSAACRGRGLEPWPRQKAGGTRGGPSRCRHRHRHRWRTRRGRRRRATATSRTRRTCRWRQ